MRAMNAALWNLIEQLTQEECSLAERLKNHDAVPKINLHGAIQTVEVQRSSRQLEAVNGTSSMAECHLRLHTLGHSKVQQHP